MGVFTLLLVSSYARPNQLIGMRKSSLTRPLATVLPHCALLLNPEEHKARSKVGDKDISLVLDSPYLQNWFEPAQSILKEGDPNDRLWTFDYSQYSKEFKKTAALLGVDLEPYQARHSGPAIDQAHKLRSQDEVQKRRPWATFKRTQRYEKHAQLVADFGKLPRAVQT